MTKTRIIMQQVAGHIDYPGEHSVEEIKAFLAPTHPSINSCSVTEREFDENGIHVIEYEFTEVTATKG